VWIILRAARFVVLDSAGPPSAATGWSGPLIHALCARSFGIRIRLKTAQLNTNNQSTFASPRSFTFFKGPICFSHPNGFSTNHRLLKLTASAAETLFQLRQQGIPATTVWSPLATANHWAVVTVPVDYRRKLDCTKDELCRKIGKIILDTKLGPQVAKMMVIHDDIDPTNLQELVWGFATRCHPGEGEIVLSHTLLSPLIAFSTKHEKFAYDGPKSVYNCLGPEDWEDKLPERSSFRFAYPNELQEKVLANWKSYGFAR